MVVFEQRNTNLVKILQFTILLAFQLPSKIFRGVKLL